MSVRAALAALAWGMTCFRRFFRVILMAVLPVVLPAVGQAQDRAEPPELPGPQAHQARLDHLFDLLARADDDNWQALEDEIWALWSQSGSDTFDLLLKRGRDAMGAGDLAAAIDHLSALTDHAPGFAEGWNARATAFYMAGRLGPSMDDIARTLSLEPRHFGALSGLGMILEDLGETQNALRAYRYALAIHPRNPGVKDAIERLETATGQDI